MSSERDLLRLLVEAYNGDSVEIMEHYIGSAIELLDKPEIKSESFLFNSQTRFMEDDRQGVADTKLELRDHFAGLAMQKLLGCPFYTSEGVALESYCQADAMIKERDK